jgi:hypothetical protein
MARESMTILMSASFGDDLCRTKLRLPRDMLVVLVGWPESSPPRTTSTYNDYCCDENTLESPSTAADASGIIFAITNIIRITFLRILNGGMDRKTSISLVD